MIPEGEILGGVEILGDGTIVDLRRVNRNLGTKPKPDKDKAKACPFQNDETLYPCASTPNPDCDLCRKVVSIKDALHQQRVERILEIIVEDFVEVAANLYVPIKNIERVFELWQGVKQRILKEGK